MIYLILGQQGSGKTLYAVYLCLRGLKLEGRRIYSNIRLHIPHTMVTFEDLCNCRLNNSMVLIDEATFWGLDSRGSMSKKSVFMTKFISQARKQNLHLLCVFQHYHMVEKRLRSMADWVIFCNKYAFHPILRRWYEVKQSKNFSKYVPIKIKTEWNSSDEETVKYQTILANSLYNCYDTEEVVSIQELPNNEQKITQTDKETTFNDESEA